MVINDLWYIYLWPHEPPLMFSPALVLRMSSLFTECAQSLVIVRSSNPALETASHSYSGFFIWLYCWSSSAKQKMCRIPIISHLQMFDLTTAITFLRGRRGGVLPTHGSGEDKPRAVPSGSFYCRETHPNHQQIQSLLHRHSISIHNFLPWCKPPLSLPRIYPTYIL